MSRPVHTVEFVSGGGNTARTDRILAGFFPGVAYPAGAGAGQSVVVTVTAKGFGIANYHVEVTPDQDCTWFVTKDPAVPGQFTVTLFPRLAANALLAGKLDVRVWA